MNINETMVGIHRNAVDKGWWETDRNIGEVIALCHSELSEALEEARKGKFETYYNELKPDKPEGVYVELADCMIRIMDYCGHIGIDLESVIREKMIYNGSRPYKHGKKF